MSRYSFDPKLDPKKGRSRRTALGAAVILAATLIGVGLIAVGCNAFSSSSDRPAATNTDTATKPAIAVTILAPQKPTLAPAQPTEPAPAEPAAQAPPAPPQPMDPRGKIEGIPDFACPNPRVAKPGFGYGIQMNWPVGDIGAFNNIIAEQLKMDWTKAQVRWKDFEPNGKEQYDLYKWQLLDAFTADINKKGVNVLFGILSTPNWARSVKEREGPPDDYAEAARFMGKVMARYKGCVQAVEVWNEMNIDREWTVPSGQITAVEYIKFLNATVPTVREIDPSVIVLMGALSPTGFEKPGVSLDDFKWLDEFVANNGVALVDCIGVHLNGFNMPPQYAFDEKYNDPTAKFRGPFDNPHHSWSFKSTLEGYYERTNKPQCVTEFGWASAENMGGAPVPGFEFAVDNTEAEQAEWLVAGFQQMKATGYVRFGIVFNLDYSQKDGIPFSEDPNAPYSVTRPDGNPRPAYEALKQMPR